MSSKPSPASKLTRTRISEDIFSSYDVSLEKKVVQQLSLFFLVTCLRLLASNPFKPSSNPPENYLYTAKYIAISSTENSRFSKAGKEYDQVVSGKDQLLLIPGPNIWGWGQNGSSIENPSTCMLELLTF